MSTTRNAITTPISMQIMSSTATTRSGADLRAFVEQQHQVGEQGMLVAADCSTVAKSD
jgi:hypothetical protein